MFYTVVDGVDCFEVGPAVLDLDGMEVDYDWLGFPSCGLGSCISVVST